MCHGKGRDVGYGSVLNQGCKRRVVVLDGQLIEHPGQSGGEFVATNGYTIYLFSLLDKETLQDKMFWYTFSVK